jgi:hypothetical protein
MAVTLNASTSSGFIQTADTSGQLVIQANGTNELTVLSTGVTVADNLLFNSGYGSAAIAYGCRAWVNFNGVGTVAIRSSGNVTSITDNGTGLFTMNFTNAMPDINYSAVGSTRRNSTSGGAGENNSNCGITFRGLSTYSTAFTTTAVQISTGTITNEGLTDFDYVAVQVFR